MLRSSSSSPSKSDGILLCALYVCASLAAAIVVFVGLFLLKESWPALQAVGAWRFLSDTDWHPKEGQFGIFPMLCGTLLAMAGSVLIATPIGIACAVFCHFYAPPFGAKILRLILDLLAGIPSVVYGFWGLVVLVPRIAACKPPGPSLVAAILILSVMILPTIALMADASLDSVAKLYLKEAAALGLSRAATVRLVVLPSAKSGLFTGVILQTGRALGETMAVLMVAGNIVQIPRSVFDPIRTLTANIALEMAYAMDIHRAALFVSGFILMILVTGLVLSAEYVRRRTIYE